MTAADRQVLFRTVHGSHLYGLAHAGSDYDFYEVLCKVPHARARWSRQSILDNVDTYRTDLGTWLTDCDKGVPQALEAMFAPAEHVLVDQLGPLRAGYRASTAQLPCFLRTIRHFILDPRYDRTPKQLRHAFRLAYAGHGIATRGRFNPTLTPTVAAQVTAIRDALASAPTEASRRFACDLATGLVWHGDLERIVQAATVQGAAGHLPRPR